MISLITNRGKLNFMVIKERFTAAMFKDFLKRLLRQVKHRIFLIVGGHPAHRSNAIRKWIAEDGSRIRM